MKRLVSIIVVASLLTFALIAIALGESTADSSRKVSIVYAAEPAKETAVAGRAKAAKMEKRDTVTTSSGLKYIDIRVGSGALPKTGQTVEVHYSGWLTDGKKIQSSKDNGVPFSFPLGQGKVIKGWDEGLSTMKVGGIRKLIIPPQLGYGATGAGGGLIPPSAVTIFEVEFLSIGKKPELEQKKQEEVEDQEQKGFTGGSKNTGTDVDDFSGSEVDHFIRKLTSAGIRQSIVLSVSADGDELTLTMADGWHYQPHQVRLQMGQRLWNMWASIHSPSTPDNSRIKLVDQMGNQVGGSRVWGGSLIWVDD